MLKRLTYILLTLFALQTTMAMADAHQWHQQGNGNALEADKHLSDNSLHTVNLKAASQASDSGTSDCHNCDHHCCHGAHGTPFVGRELVFVISSPTIQIPQHVSAAPINRSTSLYRPPIL